MFVLIPLKIYIFKKKHRKKIESSLSVTNILQNFCFLLCHMSNTALDERSDPHVYNTLLWPPALADRFLLLLLCNYWIANKPRIVFLVILPDVSWGTRVSLLSVHSRHFPALSVCTSFISGQRRHLLSRPSPISVLLFPVTRRRCSLTRALTCRPE